MILIDNAIKYTPAEGNVSVELAIHATDQEVIVKDSGIGVAVEDLDHIFEPRRARTIPLPANGLSLVKSSSRTNGETPSAWEVVLEAS